MLLTNPSKLQVSDTLTHSPHTAAAQEVETALLLSAPPLSHCLPAYLSVTQKLLTTPTAQRPSQSHSTLTAGADTREKSCQHGYANYILNMQRITIKKKELKA